MKGPTNESSELTSSFLLFIDASEPPASPPSSGVHADSSPFQQKHEHKHSPSFFFHHVRICEMSSFHESPVTAFHLIDCQNSRPDLLTSESLSRIDRDRLADDQVVGICTFHLYIKSKNICFSLLPILFVIILSIFLFL